VTCLAGDAVLIAPVSMQVPWYQGILQGILRFWGSGGRIPLQESAVLQRLLGQFPTEIIRENNLKNKEF
jgi:hypothetical protein